MRVFVAFGYQPEEKELADQVLAVLEHLGVTIEDGREIGGAIDDEVRRRIRSCDGLVGLLTRRALRGDNRYDASAYVRQEIEIALAAHPGKLVAQVVEERVVEVDGLGAAHQRIYFRRDATADLLVKLGRHVRQWVRGEIVIRILPDDLARDLARAGGGQCHYRIYEKSTEIWSSQAQIMNDGGGMFTTLLRFVPGTRAKMEIELNGARWASNLTLHTDPFSQITLDRVS